MPEQLKPEDFGLERVPSDLGPEDFGLEKVEPKETILNAQHPELANMQRFVAQNLAADKPHLVQGYLSNQGFESKPLSGGEYAVRKPGEKEWRKIEPKSGFWSSVGSVLSALTPEGFASMAERHAMTPGGNPLSREQGEVVKDITDIAGSTAAGGLSGMGGARGTIAGGPGGPATSAALGTAGATFGGTIGEEALLQAGRQAGVPVTQEEINTIAPEQGAWDAVGAAVGAGAGEGLQLAGKALKAPENVIKKMFREKQAQALEDAIQKQLRAKIELRELQKRFAGDIERRTASAEKAFAPSEVTPGVQTPKAPIAEGITPKALSPDEINQIFKTPQQKSQFRFLSQLTDPAHGVYARYLDYVPEFKAILRKWWGPEIVPEAGSKSIDWRKILISRKGTEISQEEADKISKGFAQDIATWLKGDERVGLISQAEKDAIERMAQGAEQAGDQAVSYRLIQRVIKKAAPELEEAKGTLKTAGYDVDIARAKKRLAPEGWLEKVGTWGKDWQKKIGRTWGMPLKVSGATARLVPKGMERTGAAMEQLGQWISAQTPQKLAATLKTSEEGLQPLFQGAINMGQRFGPEAFAASLAVILSRESGARDWAISQAKKIQEPPD